MIIFRSYLKCQYRLFECHNNSQFETMLSYGSPKCSETLQRAQLFCYSSECDLPAFGCSEICFRQHTNHDYRYWNQVEEYVRNALELPLQPENIKALERSQKQILIICEELKSLHQQHVQRLRQYRKNLQLKDKIKKVLGYIKSNNSHSIRGRDMAAFMDCLRSNSLFENQRLVDLAIKQAHSIFDRMLKNTNQLINQQKENLLKLASTDQMTMIQSKATIDLNVANKKMIVIFDGIYFTIKPGSSGYYPVFAKQPLCQDCQFKVKVTDVGKANFLIGVATQIFKNAFKYYYDQESICLHARLSEIYVDGKTIQTSFKVSKGDILIVRRKGGKISWLNKEKLIQQTAIPKSILTKELFPVCWILREKEKANTCTLRFQQ